MGHQPVLTTQLCPWQPPGGTLGHSCWPPRTTAGPSAGSKVQGGHGPWLYFLEPYDPSLGSVGCECDGWRGHPTAHQLCGAPASERGRKPRLPSVQLGLVFPHRLSTWWGGRLASTDPTGMQLDGDGEASTGHCGASGRVRLQTQASVSSPGIHVPLPLSPHAASLPWPGVLSGQERGACPWLLGPSDCRSHSRGLPSAQSALRQGGFSWTQPGLLGCLEDALLYVRPAQAKTTWREEAISSSLEQCLKPGPRPQTSASSFS